MSAENKDFLVANGSFSTAEYKANIMNIKNIAIAMNNDILSITGMWDVFGFQG